MTVVQGLNRDFGIAGFLVVQRISYNDKLKRLPEIPDRVRFGGELVRALAAALEPRPHGTERATCVSFLRSWARRAAS